MSHEYRLGFCKKCVNRGFDRDKGIICKLTNDIARFTNYCDDYKVIEKVEREVIKEESLKNNAAFQVRLADRITNGVIDLVAIGLIFLSIKFGYLKYTEQNIELVDSLYMFPYLYAVYVAYYLFFEMVLGKTPGKFITGTAVVNRSGHVAHLANLLVRTLVRFIPIFWISLFWSKQGLHDGISSTRVVYVNKKDIVHDDVLDA
ncbi:MAG: putative RDD family membrane protein YckC [Bacteroidia bacterium]|jgi:uncharacterized RDD family membrane protein YckC